MRQGDRHRLLQEHESVGYETVKFLAGLSEDTRDGLLRALFRERLFDNYSFADITWVVRNSTAAAAGAETKHRLSNNGTPPGATLMTPHSIPDVPIVGDASPLYTASATPAAAAPTPVVLSTSPQDPLSPYHCEVCQAPFRSDHQRKAHFKEYSQLEEMDRRESPQTRARFPEGLQNHKDPA